MVELFLRRLDVASRCTGQWLTVCIDLKGGPDLRHINVASVRLNESIRVATTSMHDDKLDLSFPRRAVDGLVGPYRRLTITGQFDDGIGFRGAVRVSPADVVQVRSSEALI